MPHTPLAFDVALAECATDEAPAGLSISILVRCDSGAEGTVASPCVQFTRGKAGEQDCHRILLLFSRVVSRQPCATGCVIAAAYSRDLASRTQGHLASTPPPLPSVIPSLRAETNVSRGQDEVDEIVLRHSARSPAETTTIGSGALPSLRVILSPPFLSFPSFLSNFHLNTIFDLLYPRCGRGGRHRCLLSYTLVTPHARLPACFYLSLPALSRAAAIHCESGLQAKFFFPSATTIKEGTITSIFDPQCGVTLKKIQWAGCLQTPPMSNVKNFWAVCPCTICLLHFLGTGFEFSELSPF